MAVRTTVLEIKNAVVVFVFIFLKHNGLSGRLADSNYFHTEESIPCTNLRINVTPFQIVQIVLYRTKRPICYKGLFWKNGTFSGGMFSITTLVNIGRSFQENRENRICNKLILSFFAVPQNDIL